MVKQAFIRSLPVMAGYLVLGIGFGIVLHDAGYGVLWALAMSGLIYAGSMQYVGVSLLTGGASILMTAVMTLLVNARHLFYSVAMIENYADAGSRKPYMIFGLTDETYSLLCNGDHPEGTDGPTFYFLVTLMDQCYWVLGSVIGALLGSVITFNTAGIDFSMTALFVTTFTEQWLTTKRHAPAVIGIAVTAVCRVVFGRTYFLIPAMVGITAILLLFRKGLDSEGGEE